MDDSLLKQTHPQKYYMKNICKFMCYIGMGDCWYEPDAITKGYNKLCKLWWVISNSFVTFGICNELFAHIRPELSEMETENLMQFTIAHPIVYSKIVTLYVKRKPIVALIKRLLEGSRATFTSTEIEKASIKSAMRYFAVLAVPLYTCLIGASLDGIRTYFVEGLPIHTEVVFYPTPKNSGILVNIIRFFVEFHWYFMMAMMLSGDTIVIGSLVIVGHRLKILQVYYQNMRSKIMANLKTKTQKELKEEFIEDFVTGIKMHDDALWCARNIQDSMGTIYSLQVLESVGLLVVCLSKMVAQERDLVFLLATLAYIGCVLSITASYMMAAGDITWEAALVTSSMFYCGWDLIHASSDVRVLTVVALQRSQSPVLMTAFGIMPMSYTNLISIIRSSYSFFAVMY